MDSYIHIYIYILEVLAVFTNVKIERERERVESTHRFNFSCSLPLTFTSLICKLKYEKHNDEEYGVRRGSVFKWIKCHSLDCCSLDCSSLDSSSLDCSLYSFASVYSHGALLSTIHISRFFKRNSIYNQFFTKLTQLNCEVISLCWSKHCVWLWWCGALCSALRARQPAAGQDLHNGTLPSCLLPGVE